MLRFSKNLRFLLLMMSLLSLSFASFAQSSKLGRVSGVKFNDLNESGTHEQNEPFLAGFTFSINSLTTDFEDTAVSDENGAFSFENLPRGTYEVCEIAAPTAENGRWVGTTPSCVQVILRGKNPHMTVRFGNFFETENGGGPGCTRTQGYWKNHEEHVLLLAPTGLTLGTRTYSVAEIDLILERSSAGGNMLVSLAHQLIAALLNGLNGADTSVVSSNISAAQSQINGFNLLTDSVDASSDLGQAMEVNKTALDNFNMGNSGVPHCN